MARTSQTTQRITREGLEPDLTAPGVDGDIVDCGSVALLVSNDGETPVTVTVLATVQQDGLDLEDLVVSVPAGATHMLVGPLPARTFGQPSSQGVAAGRAYVNYSAVADVTRAVVSL